MATVHRTSFLLCSMYLQLNIPNLAYSYGRVFQAHLQNNSFYNWSEMKLKSQTIDSVPEMVKRVDSGVMVRMHVCPVVPTSFPLLAIMGNYSVLIIIKA